MLRLLALLLFVLPAPAFAGGLIRDAEIEATLKTIAHPIFQAAGLEPDRVRIFIVQDPSINAYVAGGSNIFIHTGLLDAMETPDMLMGVLAHETGHITGGHLARGAEQLKNAQLGVILGTVLGAGTAIAGGGQAGAAVISGTGTIANRLMLSFTRTNEQSADQSALTTLDSLNVSAAGMMKTFELLRRKERMAENLDPYAVTHPLSSERIANMRSHLQQSGIPEGQYPKDLDEPFQRMRAKLYAFMNLPPKTFARYKESDTSTAGRMARAIAWYKKPDVAQAIKHLDALIKQHPDDGFLYDLKGQICFENGRIDEAIASYQKADALVPRNALIMTSFADALLAKKTASATQQAQGLLELASGLDAENGGTWRSLAVVYGRQDKRGEASLAIAEVDVLQGNAQSALIQVEQALSLLPAGSKKRLRAEDLRLEAMEIRRRQEN